MRNFQKTTSVLLVYSSFKKWFHGISWPILYDAQNASARPRTTYVIILITHEIVRHNDSFWGTAHDLRLSPSWHSRISWLTLVRPLKIYGGYQLGILKNFCVIFWLELMHRVFSVNFAFSDWKLESIDRKKHKKNPNLGLLNTFFVNMIR